VGSLLLLRLALGRLGRLLSSSVGLIAEETLEFGRCLGAL
jgi:hypothetical protein